MKVEDLFKIFLSNIETCMMPDAYNLWFSKLKPISLSETTLKILVPMGIHKKILSTNYKDLVDETLEQVSGKKYEVIYLTESDLSEEDDIVTNDTNSIGEEDISDKWNTNLNPNYTFDNYIVGESNKLAYISAKSVAENPGTIHNPFFIYGKSGIGKTHLMQAIGNYIVANTKLKVLYATSKEFIEEYAGINVATEKINYAKKFKEKYQNVDILIIDDIQFLVGAEKTQQEFFFTFNALYEKNKQIIISSDRSPKDLVKLEERLKSRSMMPLPVDIYPPDLDLRIKIIKAKLKNSTLEDRLNEEVIDYIANACTSDIRQLEGAINMLMAKTALFVPETIDLRFVNETLKDYVSYNIFAENSIEKIQRVTAEYYGVSVADLKSKKRTANVAKARQVAMYLCRVQTEETLERIGLEYGRDHSTVSAAFDKISQDIKTDVKLNTIVKELKNKL